MQRTMKPVAAALLVAVVASVGADAASTAQAQAQAQGDSYRCPAGSRTAASILIPVTTNYFTFGGGLAWLDDQHVTDPVDPFEPGTFFQDAVAVAADGRAIVRTISKTTGTAPFVDEWGSGPERGRLRSEEGTAVGVTAGHNASVTQRRVERRDVARRLTIDEAKRRNVSEQDAMLAPDQLRHGGPLRRARLVSI